MTSKNLRIHTVFIAILLLLSVLTGQLVNADNTAVPESVSQLLSGKTVDFSDIAGQIPEHQLPTALAAAGLLKFRALHGEISLSAKEAAAFEELLLARISSAKQIAFSQTEICHKKVEQREIMFDGQKLIVPEYFEADTALAITECQPKGEAGCLFPDFHIGIFSQTPLTDVKLVINGQIVDPGRIQMSQNESCFELLYRTPALSEAFLAIGTHTAEISIRNQAGEFVNKQWSFTVGIYDVSTPPLPDNAKLIGEINLSGSKLFPGQKISGSLCAVIYEDPSGKKYVEYCLTTPTGQIIKSRNLAFIGREMLAKRAAADDLTLSPKTSYAFIGNELNFSQTWAGSGKVLSVDWQINSGEVSTTETFIKMAGNTFAKCTVVIEDNYTDNAGNQTPFQYKISADKSIRALCLSANIFSNRMLQISNNATASFALKVAADCVVTYADGNELIQSDMAEGIVYSLGSAATLKVERLRWKIHAQEGNPTIKNPVATTTQLLFTKPGFAELVLDAKLVWQQQGETYESDLKPETSGLYAFYPVKGSAQFSKYPQGQLSAGTRHIVFKSFELEIKQQKRIVTTPENAEFAEPIQICGSALWPASSPLRVFKATPLIFNAKNNHEIETVKPFVFKTPMEISDKSIELNLGGELHSDENSSKTDRTVIGKLPAIPVYDENEVLQLRLYPEELVTVYEGQEQTFKAEIEPLPGLGQGVYPGASQNLNVLNGYSVSSVEHVLWYEEPLGDEGDWKTKAERGVDFSHIFNPLLGPGSYTMNCGVVMSLRETDTDDEVPVYLESLVPVDALPGLRIFSPINELAYPLNVSLKVKSSFDKEKNIWKKIKWRLNGKEYNHGLDEGPFYIELNRVGKWSLQAELTIKNPQNGEDIILKDRVDFTVNPVEIGLTPTRKVLDFDLQKSQKLSLNITLNGKKVEKPGKPVEWGQDGLVALVDPIEWFSATEPDNCATVNSDENNLTTEAGFTAAGATTVLATVTIRLTDGENYFRRKHKGFEDEFEEPVFSFPAVRADLWAITFGNMRNIKGIFPEKAITRVERTFKVHSFDFDFLNKKYSYSSQVEQPLAISLEPALKGGAPVKSTGVSFAWSAKEHNKDFVKDENIFKFIPEKDGQYEVSFTSYLDFASNGKFSLGEKKYNILSVPFDSLMHGSVNPSSFTLRLGETQELACKVWSDDPAQPPPTNVKDQTLTILGGAYEVGILKVEWTENANSSKQVVEASTYNFVAKIPGIVKGAAIVYFSVWEIVDNQKRIVKGAWMKRWEFLAQVKDIEVKILANGEPINDQEFYQGQKINLKYTASLANDNLILKNIKWSFEGALPLSKIEYNSSPLPDGLSSLRAYKVLPLKKDELEKQELEFFLFDYNSNKDAVVGTFSYTINEQSREKGFVIPYSKVMVEEFIPENSLDDIQIFEVASATWSIGFPITNDPTPGAFEAEAAFNNKTSTRHLVGGFQLVKIDAIRSFVDSENHVRKQFLKSINESASFSTEAEFWLDKWYPAQTSYFNLYARPNDKTPLFDIISDNPRLPLTKDIIFDGVTYQAATFTAKITFHTFLFAKPDDQEISYHSFIVPLQTYESAWEATASYDKTTDKWVKLAGQVHRFKEIDLPILEWKNLALGSGDNQSPKWRDLKE